MAMMVTVVDVLAAQQIVRPYVWHTPLLPSAALSQMAGGDVSLKLECWQQTGSFKVRGALARLATLPADAWARGVVTASAGNHGLGMAYASRVLALPPPIIFVPENAAAAKVHRLATFDCQVRRVGADYDASHAAAEAYAREKSAVYLSAYDDPVVIAGQGTVGLEVMEERPDTDVLLVPVGGGGLVAGMAVVAKAIRPAIRVVGVQPEASPSAFLSLRDGRPHETYPAGPTICDGLAGGFGRVPFEVAAELIDEIIVVPEHAVRQAVAWLLSQEQLMVEGSGAIAVAPLLSGQLDVAGRRVVAVLTGRNMDAAVLNQILSEQQGEIPSRWLPFLTAKTGRPPEAGQ